MANNHEPIPGPDADFDTLQKLIVQKVVANAVDWDIPAAEITKLTDAQAPWTAAWAIAQFKNNVTTAQREAKDLARKNYEKVLRTFIQKWIYRNSSMTDDDVLECGLKPRDTTRTPATKIGLITGIILKKGLPLQLVAECPKTPGAKYYGCILVEGSQLPPHITIGDNGELIIGPSPIPDPNPGPVSIHFSLTEKRKKVFSNLKHDVTYYCYFYLVNAAGVSPLTEWESEVCW